MPSEVGRGTSLETYKPHAADRPEPGRLQPWECSGEKMTGYQGWTYHSADLTGLSGEAESQGGKRSLTGWMGGGHFQQRSSTRFLAEAGLERPRSRLAKRTQWA